MARGRTFTEMGALFTPIFPGAQTFVAAADTRPILTNRRGRTLGWIGLLALLKELFNAASI